MEGLFYKGNVDFKMSFTTRCSARCVTCLNHTITEHCELEWDVFEKYIRAVAELAIPNKKTVWFYNIGEAYLHPHFVPWCEKAIRLLKKRGIKTGVVTNGADMDRGGVPEGIDYFEISFNAGERKTYEMITGLAFDRVYANINRLYHAGEFGKAGQTSIRLLCFDANAGQEEAFRNLFRKMHGVKYRMNYMYDNQFEETEYTGVIERKQRNPCEYLTNKVLLYPNGDINLCAHDFCDSVVFGNLKEDSLQEILRGEKRMRLIREHEAGKFAGLCEKCNFNADRRREYVATGYFDPLEDAVFQAAKKVYRNIKRIADSDAGRPEQGKGTGCMKRSKK